MNDVETMDITKGRTVRIRGIMGNFHDKFIYGILRSNYARTFAYGYN